MNLLIALLLLFLPHQQEHSTAKLIICGIDSLTRRDIGTGYIDYLVPELKSKYNDGGPGYVAFNDILAKNEKMDLSVTNGLSFISNDHPSEYPAKYSFDFKGVYSENGHDESITLDLHRSWESGKVFYLLQPQGGSFIINGKLINSKNENYTLGVYDIPAGTSVSITHINGKVVLFGGLFLNNHGVAVSQVGKGGHKLSDYAQLDSNLQKQWIDELNPSMFLFNGVYNDRSSSEAYGVKLEHYLLPFINHGTKLILVMPHENKYSHGVYDGFDKEIQRFAERQQTDYQSNKQLFGGSYEAGSRYIGPDGSHPNDQGNQLISDALLKIVEKRMQ